jgi:hypothetical protein
VLGAFAADYAGFEDLRRARTMRSTGSKQHQEALSELLL